MAHDAPEEGMMSMSAGDFVDVYARPHYANSFDCVATCFFLDCAHNIIEFVEIIHRILKVPSTSKLVSPSSAVSLQSMSTLQLLIRHVSNRCPLV